MASRGSGPGVWRRVWRRVAASNADLDAEQLQQRSLAEGAVPIGQVKLRTRVEVRGRVEVLTLNPKGSARWLEAELRDGTGSITLVWMGRRRIRGLRAGRRLAAEGLVALDDGRQVIYNPRYTILPE